MKPARAILFTDRLDAGRRLTRHLAPTKLPRPVTLALPCGGLPVGFATGTTMEAALAAIRRAAPARLIRVVPVAAPSSAARARQSSARYTWLPMAAQAVSSSNVTKPRIGGVGRPRTAIMTEMVSATALRIEVLGDREGRRGMRVIRFTALVLHEVRAVAHADDQARPPRFPDPAPGRGPATAQADR